MALQYNVIDETGATRVIEFKTPDWAITKLIWGYFQTDQTELAIEAAFTNLCNAEDRAFLMTNGAAAFQISTQGGLLDKLFGSVSATFIKPSKGTK